MSTNVLNYLQYLQYLPQLIVVIQAVQAAEAAHGAGAGAAKLAAATTIIQQAQAAGLLDKFAGDQAKSTAIVNDVVQLLNDIGGLPK